MAQQVGQAEVQRQSQVQQSKQQEKASSLVRGWARHKEADAEGQARSAEGRSSTQTGGGDECRSADGRCADGAEAVCKRREDGQRRRWRRLEHILHSL